MYTNLITTGCSYTSYLWKTWADYLSSSFDTYHNFGLSGSGPRYSWVQINNYLSTHAKHSTLENTVIAVQWSSLMRNDIYKKEPYAGHYWTGGGQINNNVNYDSDYLEKYFDLVDKALDLQHYIESLILASEKYKFRLVMMYMLEPWIYSFGGEPTGGLGKYSIDEKIKDFYKTDHPKILEDLYNTKHWIRPSIELFTADVPDPNKDPNDGHPSPLQHFHYANKIREHLNIEPVYDYRFR